MFGKAPPVGCLSNAARCTRTRLTKWPNGVALTAAHVPSFRARVIHLVLEISTSTAGFSLATISVFVLGKLISFAVSMGGEKMRKEETGRDCRERSSHGAIIIFIARDASCVQLWTSETGTSNYKVEHFFSSSITRDHYLAPLLMRLPEMAQASK